MILHVMQRLKLVQHRLLCLAGTGLALLTTSGLVSEAASPTPTEAATTAWNPSSPQRSPTLYVDNLITNQIGIIPAIPTFGLGFNQSNSTPAHSSESTNAPGPAPKPDRPADDPKHRLDTARHIRMTQRGADTTPTLISLLGETTPDPIRKAALLELAAAAQDQRNLARAQQIYSQYAQKWPDDQYLPEVLLRQGQLFREQGLNKMALAKFYAVMTSALVLKHNQFDYYARLVIEAQIQVAQTHFQLEKFAEAGDFFARLLKQDSPHINRQEVQFKLIACLVNAGKFEEAVVKGMDFLDRYPDSPEQAEVRFHLASALKQLDRNNDALAQVLALLREQNSKAKANPGAWAYWQQRTGNLVANQLFREGDYTRALEIYLGLTRLNQSPAWQLPLFYQIGMTYERLWQPEKATATYTDIIKREPEFATNATPGLKAIVEMARWRIGFVEWQSKAENFTRGLSKPDPLNPSPSPTPSTIASTPALDPPNQ